MGSRDVAVGIVGTVAILIFVTILILFFSSGIVQLNYSTNQNDNYENSLQQEIQSLRVINIQLINEINSLKNKNKVVSKNKEFYYDSQFCNDFIRKRERIRDDIHDLENDIDDLKDEIDKKKAKGEDTKYLEDRLDNWEEDLDDLERDLRDNRDDILRYDC